MYYISHIIVTLIKFENEIEEREIKMWPEAQPRLVHQQVEFGKSVDR